MCKCSNTVCRFTSTFICFESLMQQIALLVLFKLWVTINLNNYIHIMLDYIRKLTIKLDRKVESVICICFVQACNILQDVTRMRATLKTVCETLLLSFKTSFEMRLDHYTCLLYTSRCV